MRTLTNTHTHTGTVREDDGEQGMKAFEGGNVTPLLIFRHHRHSVMTKAYTYLPHQVHLKRILACFLGNKEK